jgi:hypothetical protein
MVAEVLRHVAADVIADLGHVPVRAPDSDADRTFTS